MRRRRLLGGGLLAATAGLGGCALALRPGGGPLSRPLPPPEGDPPFGAGRVLVPEGARALFLPQRPYLPLGTLRRALAYPAAPDAFAPAALEEALRVVGLDHLVPRLEEEDAWSLRLSGGEQQRLQWARALLNRPDWLFLDEATASLDPAMEQRLHAALLERLPGLTLVSIAHRPALAEFHGTRWEVRDGRLLTGPGRAP